MIRSFMLDNAALLGRDIREGPNAAVRDYRIVCELHPGFRSYLIWKYDVIIAFDIIGHEVGLIGVDDWIDVIKSEVEILVLREEGINLFLRGAPVVWGYVVAF